MDYTVKIKICGLTNLADVRLAVEQGADLIGFIFAASPRKVKRGEVKEIVENLPPGADKVGVFANQNLQKVKEISSYCKLDYIQLHGDESPEYCSEFDLPVIKAFQVKDETYLDHLKKYEVDKYLLDTYHPDKLGGTGETFNWELAREAKEYGEVLIAGGLNEVNVKEAIKIVTPWGVDIGSGIEAAPGKKDQEKLKEVIKQIKNYNNKRSE